MDTVEFVVEGRPKTARSASGALAAWKRKVRAAAEALGVTPTSEADLFLYIVFFHDGVARIDSDNIVKPIADALEGIVYHSDNQVRDQESRKRDINGSYPIRGVSPILVLALCKGGEFVYVRVTNLGKKAEDLV